ncbi:MAG: hypothetical protein AB1349_02910 [Elusimicrobiota bacterium]
METGMAIGIIALMFTVYAWYNGRAMRNLLKELFSKMDERAEQRHREVIETSEQRHREVMETLKQQHQDHLDNVELLKKGFGDLTKEAKEIKTAIGR